MCNTKPFRKNALPKTECDNRIIGHLNELWCVLKSWTSRFMQARIFQRASSVGPNNSSATRLKFKNSVQTPTELAHDWMGQVGWGRSESSCVGSGRISSLDWEHWCCARKRILLYIPFCITFVIYLFGIGHTISFDSMDSNYAIQWTSVSHWMWATTFGLI